MEKVCKESNLYGTFVIKLIILWTFIQRHASDPHKNSTDRESDKDF